MATAPPIQLDLRRDLPKVRAAYDELIEGLGSCYYSTPCAIGAMMSAADRGRIATRLNSRSILNLYTDGRVAFPDHGQAHDARALQRAFDAGQQGKFDIVLAELEAKYLAA